MPYQYDPNQPRVPKGSSNGGKWTRAGHGPQGLTEFSAVRVRVEPVPLEFGGRMGGAGGLVRGGGLVGGAAAASHKGINSRAQTLIESGREERIAEGFRVFAEASALNGPDRQAVLILEAHAYPNTGDRALELASVRLLSQKEVREACHKFEIVQKLTDDAVDTVKGIRQKMSESAYGTKVHYALKQEIESLGDPYLTAEVSVQKTIEETGLNPGAQGNVRADGLEITRYGAVNSLRIDVLEREGQTACVYDIKTGRGLSRRRYDDIGLSIGRAYKGNPPTRIIVTEVRETKKP